MLPMNNFCLIRHPPALNIEGCCYGRLDVDVEPEHLSQAADTLRTTLPALPVFSSPARRCMALAAQLAEEFTVLDDLAELDFGEWEGQRWDNIPRNALDDWAAKPWTYRPGGGESAQDVLLRWRAARTHIAQQARTGSLVVSHAGLIRLALWDAGQLPTERFWAFPVAHAQPYVVPMPC
jgi:alpha-ribazole phosphatase